MAWQARATAPACSARLRVGAARRSNNAVAELAGPAGSVLMVSSPPVPEPERPPRSLRAVLAATRFRQGHLNLDVHGVTQLERAEHAGIRLDAELGLDDRGRGAVAVVAGLADLKAKRAGLAVQGERTADRAAAPAVGLELLRGERRLRVAVGRDLLSRGHGDLAAVPVGQRLDAAPALAHHQGAHVDADLQAGLGKIITVARVQVSRPSGHLDRQIVAGLSRQPAAVGTQEKLAVIRAEPVASAISRHDSHRRTHVGKRPVAEWTEMAVPGHTELIGPARKINLPAGR